jgi:hypothetical protein
MSHWYGNLKPENIEKYFVDLVNSKHKYPSVWACFGGIGQKFNYNTTDPFYFGFDIDPVLAERFVKDFNNRYKNIQIEIAYSVKLYRYTDSFYGEIYFLEEQPDKKLVTELSGCKCPLCQKNLNRHFKYFTLFNIKFNGYSKRAEFTIIPIIGELLRTYTFFYGQSYNGEYVAEVAYDYPEELFIKAWEIDQAKQNNCILNPMDIKYMLALDDVEKYNWFLVSGHLNNYSFTSLVYPTNVMNEWSYYLNSISYKF